MPDRFWVGGTGFWDGLVGTKWSATSGGAGGASIPTALDNVYFDSNSGGGVVTVNINNRACLNLSFRGLSGTSDFTGIFAGTAALNISGGIILSASTTYTYSGTTSFLAALGSYNITCNGATWASGMTFNGVAATWNTTDIFRITGALTLTAGTINFSYDTYLAGIITSGSTTRVINFIGVGGTLINLYLTGIGTLANISGATGLSMVCGFDCYVTNSSASAKTLTYGTVFQNNNNVYLGGSGSGSITFSAGTTGNPYVYVTNTGAAPISFESGSISALVWESGTNAVWSNVAGRTLTIGSDLIMTSSMGTPTLTPSIIFTMNGSTSGANAVFVTANKTFVTGTITFNDLGAFYIMQVTGNINCNSNITITAADLGIYINGNINQSLIANILTLTAGTLVMQNGGNVTCGLFVSNNSNVRTLNMGSGNWNITGTGTVWNLTNAANMTLNCGTSRIVISNTSATINTFASGGSLTYYTIEYARGGGGARLNVDSLGSGNTTTIANFIDNTSTAAHSLNFGAGTYNFYKFNVRGSAGALVQISRSGAISPVLNKVGQGIVPYCDYLNIATAAHTATPANTWYAGANSTGSGTGWVMTAAPSSQSLLGAGGVG